MVKYIDAHDLVESSTAPVQTETITASKELLPLLRGVVSNAGKECEWFLTNLTANLTNSNGFYGRASIVREKLTKGELQA